MRRRSEDVPRRKHARTLTGHALARGEITKGVCAECGAIKVEAHHRDYDRPLDVVWLCRAHHLAEHGKQNGAGSTDQSVCTKCGDEPRAGGSVWGKTCLAAQKREQRARRAGTAINPILKGPAPVGIIAASTEIRTASAKRIAELEAEVARLERELAEAHTKLEAASNAGPQAGGPPASVQAHGSAATARRSKTPGHAPWCQGVCCR